MGGLLILFIFGLYIFATTKILSVIHQPRIKALAILVAILIPTADAIYGRIEFKAMCEADAGLRIYRSAEKVTGFSTGEDSPSKSWVTKFGYSYVEGYRFGSRNMQTIRYESDGAGGAVEKIEPKGVLQSRYLLQETKADSGTHLRMTVSIVEIASGETMSSDTSIIYFGGWVERAVSGLYAARGTADFCPKPFDIYQRLIVLVTHTLKPISGNLAG